MSHIIIVRTATGTLLDWECESRQAALDLIEALMDAEYACQSLTLWYGNSCESF